MESKQYIFYFGLIVDNYIFVCTSMGEMHLKSVRNSTHVHSQNSVNGEQPCMFVESPSWCIVPITCGHILTGSHYVLTGDVGGNIRVGFYHIFVY